MDKDTISILVEVMYFLGTLPCQCENELDGLKVMCPRCRYRELIRDKLNEGVLYYGEEED